MAGRSTQVHDASESGSTIAIVAMAATAVDAPNDPSASVIG